MLGQSSLSQLALLRPYRSMRSSSWDRTGGNRDFVVLKPGETMPLLETGRPGCVKHLWVTVGGGGEDVLRALVLRMWWDGEESPSVECPLGDFFGLGFGRFKVHWSLPIQAAPGEGRGMNCWWSMPFDQARITITSEAPEDASVYFCVDYEAYDQPVGVQLARFHAQWRREAATEGWLTERLGPDNVWEVWDRRPNLTGEDNYLILDAIGNGVYVGCCLFIDCFSRQGNDWYGEGDDMIFIDGEPWPPRLHGTGTEDYFCTAFGPSEEFCSPYFGLTRYSGNRAWPWKGKNAMHRFHIEDPIRFEKSCRVTIEHGSSNKLTNDYSSVAFWYQHEPHGPFPALLPVSERLARPDEPQFP